MTDLYLKPTQDGTGVRLYPANHAFFYNVNNLWVVAPDECVPSDIATIIFNAYHGLHMREHASAEKLCMYINTFLTGKRLVICGKVHLELSAIHTKGTLTTSCTIPALCGGEVNDLDITSLLDSAGVLPNWSHKLSMWYDVTIGEYGAIRVYVDGIAYCIVHCKVQ